MNKKLVIVSVSLIVLVSAYFLAPIVMVKIEDYKLGDGSWNKNVGSYAENSIIKNGILYQNATSDGIYMLNPKDGSVIHHWKFGAGSATAPVVIGDYIYAWSYVGEGGDSKLYKINKNTGEYTSIVGTDADFEVLTTANVNGVDLIFIPKDGYITAIKASDLSIFWTSLVKVSHKILHWDGGMVVGNYLYTRRVGATRNKLVKLNLSDGKIVDEVELDSDGYYAPLLYDKDRDQIIITESGTLKVKAYDAHSFELNWVYTMEESPENYYIMYGGSYHNGVYYISNKATSNVCSYMYAIDTANGNKIWKSSEAYKVSVVMINTVVSDDYLFVPTHDYADHNYRKMMVLDVKTGKLIDTIDQSGDSACASPLVTGGKMFLGMWEDRVGDQMPLGLWSESMSGKLSKMWIRYMVNARKLGSGEYLDSSYKMDAYHTGYIGKRLTEYNPN